MTCKLVLQGNCLSCVMRKFTQISSDGENRDTELCGCLNGFSEEVTFAGPWQCGWIDDSEIC